MKIYVGNLSYETTKEDLCQEFEAFGEVKSVDIIVDKYSGQSRGFAFVEMASVSEGQAAINSLNGKTMGNRTLIVNPARDRSEDRGGGSYGNRGGSGSYGKKKGGGFSKGKQRRY